MWKTAFKKFTWSTLEYFVPFNLVELWSFVKTYFVAFNFSVLQQNTTSNFYLLTKFIEFHNFFVFINGHCLSTTGWQGWSVKGTTLHQPISNSLKHRWYRFFAKNIQRLLSLNYFHKKVPSKMSVRVRNTPLALLDFVFLY